MSGTRTPRALAILGRAAPSGANKEYGMSMDSVERFLTALDPDHREAVSAKPHEEQQRLADAWERELADDTELDTLDELSPPAAEAEAARRVLGLETG
ncbi:hypothetical protein GCM10010478_07910 [Streptomyces erythrogriseus]|nr:hypothetical protein [Streptomyces sp. OS603R]MCA2205073.1 hypothetical protein [Streptomyces sp. SMS_SU21]GGP64175.1 hypothetical protein GCM10010265_47970 [Streptomyces griseoincarnatus]GGQ41424.1 hypothetical protein GCM10010250_09910 [Streptomyces althioticus]GGT50770.1 hypothetical protein GCM10010287_25860 [Streptomyces variabilis]